MTPSQQMDPRERLWLAIIGVFVIAVLLLQDEPVRVERARHATECVAPAPVDTLDAARCRTRAGMAVPTADGPLACIDSATLVALPAPEVP